MTKYIHDKRYIVNVCVMIQKKCKKEHGILWKKEIKLISVRSQLSHDQSKLLG